MDSYSEMKENGEENQAAEVMESEARTMPSSLKAFDEILPKTGLVFSERGNLTEVLCKPKILPLKSATLIRMEDLERKVREEGKKL